MAEVQQFLLDVFRELKPYLSLLFALAVIYAFFWLLSKFERLL